MERLLKLMLVITDPSPYMKESGPSDPYHLTRTCVLDSLLTALHTSYIKYSNMEDLLNRNDFFKTIMTLLMEKKYNMARKLCVQEVNFGKLDLYGNVKDYFPLFNKLVYTEIIYKQNPTNDIAIYKKIQSILKKCGDIKMVLDTSSEVTLILLHRDVHNILYQDCTALPLHLDDGKKSIFGLQFLLIGKNEHMITCFQSSENKWHLYDNNPDKPSFQPIDLEHLTDYVVCLAGYINITQAKECKYGIAETGEGLGPKPIESSLAKEQDYPFNHFYLQQSMADVEMKDLVYSSSYSVPIAETGKGTGIQPFYQKQGEDIEMLSCSSLDSD